MPAWTPNIATKVRAACQEGLGRLCEALSSTLERPYSATLDDHTTETDLGPAGLVFFFGREDQVLLAALPASAGFLPDWVRQPDKSQRTALAGLAAQVGALLLPGELAPTSADVQYSDDLSAELLQRGTNNSAYLQVQLNSGEQSGTLTLFWPSDTASRDAAASVEGTEPPDRVCDSPGVAAGPRPLPPHSRSLLRIRVPVKVVLADTRLPLKHVLELGPGSIIQFKKACEDTLTLEVSDQVIAEGEAVKVGDKFGLWITSIAKPAERFFVVEEGERRRRVL